MQFKSELLFKSMYDLDQNILEYEARIEELLDEAVEYKKTIAGMQQDNYNSTMNLAGNMLSALISKPKLDGVSAILLNKMRDMYSVGEIHNYIDSIFEQYKEENPTPTTEQLP